MTDTAQNPDVRQRLAEAIRLGDADRALELLRAGDEHIEFIESDNAAKNPWGRASAVGLAVDIAGGRESGVGSR